MTTQTLDKKRKIIIASTAFVLITAVGVTAYNQFVSNKAPEIPPELINLEQQTTDTEVSYLQPELVPAVVQPSIQTQVMSNFFSPEKTTIDMSIPESAKQILNLSEQIQLSELNTVADKAALAAKQASKALKGDTSAAILNGLLADEGHAKATDLIDSIKVKSLVSTAAGITGWVMIGNELMPTKKGAKIGKYTVSAMTEQYIEFSYNGQVSRKYSGS